MINFCRSCGTQISNKLVDDALIKFCEYCTDENGNLRSREEILAGIADWLKLFTADKSTDFKLRAESYLKAMPAWADSLSKTH